MMIFFNYVFIFMTALFSFPSVSANVNPPIDCPKELFRQKIMCHPGQALSSVTWDEKIPNCRHVNATCKNATSSCFEQCEWSPMCQTNASVSIEMEYVRGIEVVYEYMEDKQTASFLCCHSDELKTGILDCDGKSTTELDGRSQPKLFSIMSQAMSKDYSLSLRGELPAKVTYCPILNIPTCPPDKIQTNLEGSSFPGPGGTVGSGTGGGGGGGLVLNLDDGNVCTGSDVSGMIPDLRIGWPTGILKKAMPTATACKQSCQANPACTMAVFLTTRYICYHNGGVTYNLPMDNLPSCAFFKDRSQIPPGYTPL